MSQQNLELSLGLVLKADNTNDKAPGCKDIENFEFSLIENWKKIFVHLGVDAEVSVQPKLTNIIANKDPGVGVLSITPKASFEIKNSENADVSLGSAISDTIRADSEPNTSEYINGAINFFFKKGIYKENSASFISLKTLIRPSDLSYFIDDVMPPLSPFPKKLKRKAEADETVTKRICSETETALIEKKLES